MSYLMTGIQLRMKNPNLASIVGKLTNIRELNLDGVAISAEGDEWCKALSSSLPHLQVLSMYKCDLQGIQPSLAKLHNLSVIRLSGNNFTGAIPEFLARFENLTTVQLADCGLIDMLPSSIFQIPTLKTLDLSYNSMLQGSLPDFPRNSSLQELVLSYTNLSGLLPSSISNLKQLQKIDLRSCSFWGSIPTSMQSLYQLEYMDFSLNSFSGPIPLLSSRKNLKNLKLNGNCLNGSISSIDWGGMINLENVDLSGNALKGSIPTSLFLLPSLRGISLAQNNFSGKLSEFASEPSSLLRELDLSSNTLEGPVPKSVFQLRRLAILNISSNRFNDTLALNEILQHLKNLSYNHLSVIGVTNASSASISYPQLNTLRLASCNLTILPEFLKSQSNMKLLDVSDNQIQDEVPRWIWGLGIANLNLSCNKFTNLEKPLPHISIMESLDLHSNQLQGQVPEIEYLNGGLYLDFSNNRFTSMSPNLGNSIPYAIFLSLSMNNISGSIPTSLCNATNLRVLDLEHNNFNGTIPECLLAINQNLSLGVLNLGGNKVSGIIPDKFVEGCTLETLILNGNYLQGQIPRSLFNCRFLKVLHLGNNQLNDTFPCQLKSLSNLQVLILRSNKFHGPVACPESNSIGSSLGILDLASNHFSGKLTAQFFLKWTSMARQASETQSGISYLEYPVLLLDQIYYRDEVAVTFKGIERMLQKIIQVFTSIDISNNDFHGEIPRELGNLNALVVLNLSHNSLSGNIPSSIGNLSQIQSLDLSCNALGGIISPQLATLNFLEYLNLSYNKLSGKIPTGTQLQSFDPSSFEGNQGLYGPPLTPISRSESDPGMTPQISPQNAEWSSKDHIEWMLRGAEVGLPVGITVFIGPLLYIKSWRQWYCMHLHKIVMKILRKEDSRRGRSRHQRQRD